MLSAGSVLTFPQPPLLIKERDEVREGRGNYNSTWGNIDSSFCGGGNKGNGEIFKSGTSKRCWCPSGAWKYLSFIFTAGG